MANGDCHTILKAAVTFLTPPIISKRADFDLNFDDFRRSFQNRCDRIQNRGAGDEVAVFCRPACQSSTQPARETFPIEREIERERETHYNPLYCPPSTAAMVETRSSARKAARTGHSDDTDTTGGVSGATSGNAAKRGGVSGGKGGARGGYSLARVAAAWLVHLYTGLGLPVNCYAVHVAMYTNKSFGMWIALNWLAIFIDATDGTLARAAEVKKVIPGYDGAGLDNIIDYITFAFSPALAICVFEIVPDVRLQMLCAFMILIAAGYQFCQTTAKTDEAFVGFPSYWNILVHYLYYLKASPFVVVASVAFCAGMSFVPYYFLYPSRTKYMQVPTLVGATIWALMMLAPSVRPGPTSDLAIRLSLLYVVYYCVVSELVNRQRRAAEEEERKSD